MAITFTEKRLIATRRDKQVAYGNSYTVGTSHGGGGGTSLSGGESGQIAFWSTTSSLSGTTGFTITGETVYVQNINVSGIITNDNIITNINDVWTGTTKVREAVTLSAAEYAAIGTKNPQMIYFIL